MRRNLLPCAVAVVAIAIAGAGTQACAQTAPADVQAVDLGLPSGIKWASCNVGATTPEQGNRIKIERWFAMLRWRITSV